MSTTTSKTDLDGWDDCRDEYHRLTQAYFELVDRKYRFENTPEDRAGDEEYHTLVLSLAFISAQMDAIVTDLIEHHEADTAFHVLL